MSAQPNLRVVPPSPFGAKPLLRWAGGKSWFVKEFGDDFFSHVFKRGGRYIEPFAGGAAMALHFGLQPGFGLPWSSGEGWSTASSMILGDAEEDIAVMYSVVRDEPEALIALLGLLEEQGTDEGAYYRVRGTDASTAVERAAKVLYLNRLCFNGLYRKNVSGNFNVPYGKKEKPLHAPEQIREASQALQGAEIHPCDFNLLLVKAHEDDTVYLDPPYDVSGHTNYTDQGFGKKDQRCLARVAKRAFERGADIFAHNADTPLIRELWGDWAKMIPMPEKRSINRDGSRRGEVPCVLMVASHERSL